MAEAKRAIAAVLEPRGLLGADPMDKGDPRITGR